MSKFFKHKVGDSLTVRLKTFPEIKKTYKFDGGRFQHPTGGIGATLSIHRGAIKYFGTEVTVTLKYIKRDRTIWQFLFSSFKRQMIYGDWFYESLLDEELFEI